MKPKYTNNTVDAQCVYSRGRSDGSAKPITADRNVIKPNAPIAPQYTTSRGCRIAIMHAMKNVLSPSSVTMIIATLLNSADQNGIVKASTASTVALYFSGTTLPEIFVPSAVDRKYDKNSRRSKDDDESVSAPTKAESEASFNGSTTDGGGADPAASWAASASEGRFSGTASDTAVARRR